MVAKVWFGRLPPGVHEEEIEKLLPQEGLIEFGCNPNKSAAM